MERIYKKIWRQGAQTYPINKLFVYLNNYCNLKCKYCFYTTKPPLTVNISDFKKALKILIKNSTDPSITILGGEPLLSISKLKEILKIASSQNIPIVIFTNGTLIDENYKKLVGRYNPKTVISIDGDKLTTDKDRRFKNSNKSVYDTIIKNLKRLNMIELVSVNMVITPQNAGKLSKNIKHLYNLGFRSIGISFDYSAKWLDSTILKLKRELKKMFIEYAELLQKGVPYRFLNMYEAIEKAQDRDIPPCSNLILLWDGFIYPCDKIISMESSVLERFRLKNDILSQRQLFFKKLSQEGVESSQGFCEVGLYLYLKYGKGLDKKELIKRLNRVRRLKKEIEKILFRSFKLLIKIPLFRKIHNI